MDKIEKFRKITDASTGEFVRYEVDYVVDSPVTENDRFTVKVETSELQNPDDMDEVKRVSDDKARAKKTEIIEAKELVENLKNLVGDTDLSGG